MDRGFTVTRAYEAVDKPEDVKQDPDGTWHVKSGASVRVRVGMVAPTRRYHVALVDPLPAGFEPVNPALAVSGPIPQDPKAQTSPYWWWRGTWFVAHPRSTEPVGVVPIGTAGAQWRPHHEETFGGHVVRLLWGRRRPAVLGRAPRRSTG